MTQHPADERWVHPCMSLMTCLNSGSPVPCQDREFPHKNICPYKAYTGYPDRTPEILRNNYAVFMKRAYSTQDFKYKADCVAAAQLAEKHFKIITGREMNLGSTEK